MPNTDSFELEIAEGELLETRQWAKEQGYHVSTSPIPGGYLAKLDAKYAMPVETTEVLAWHAAAVTAAQVNAR